MHSVKECDKCIWYDQCHESEVCEHYYPVSEEEQDELYEEEYKADIRMRYNYYQKLINEHNS